MRISIIVEKISLALLIILSHGAMAEDNRPNILYCLADDWSWPHAGVYGDKIVKTPNFDRIAAHGILFTQAHSAAPSCTPSRAAMLTGRAVHQLEEGANLHGFLPRKFPVYPNLLEKSGYAVGFQKRDGALEILKQATERAIPPETNSKILKNF